jgi:hypothetical protein
MGSNTIHRQNHKNIPFFKYISIDNISAGRFINTKTAISLKYKCKFVSGEDVDGIINCSAGTLLIEVLRLFVAKVM